MVNMTEISHSALLRRSGFSILGILLLSLFAAPVHAVNLALSQFSGDLVSEQAMSISHRDTLSSGWGPFASVGGYSLRNNNYLLDNAGNLDRKTHYLKGNSLIAGLAGSTGNLTLGVFFEYGKGSYRNYYTFANSNFKQYETDVRNLGGGLFGHFIMSADNNGHNYIEMSARGGKSRNLYEDLNGDTANVSLPYYGAHLGVGHVLIPDKKSELDFHAKYLWNRQKGDSVTFNSEDVRFETVDSHRLRLGARGYREIADNVKPYLGLAWEHEFSGRARISTETDGRSLKIVNFKEDSGIVELGVKVGPYSKRVPFAVDLGLKSHIGGQREGVSGNLNMRWGF